VVNILINFFVILITLIVSAFFDLKQKTVPGVVIYPLIIFGMFNTLLLIAAGTGIERYFTLIGAGAVIVCGLILQKYNFIGGADTLLILGIVLSMPAFFSTFNFYLTFEFLTCLTGLIYYGIMWGAKQAEPNIKFVPCVLLGYSVALFGMYWFPIYFEILRVLSWLV